MQLSGNTVLITFVQGVLHGLEQDTDEIGYGMTASYRHASRNELDQRFIQMNRHM